jgi:hypothetical protein
MLSTVADLHPDPDNVFKLRKPVPEFVYINPRAHGPRSHMTYDSERPLASKVLKCDISHTLHIPPLFLEKIL